MLFPEVDVGSEIEPYFSYDQAKGCDPQQRAGVAAFRDFVLSRMGGSDLGMLRACKSPDEKLSLHHEGRAWDWGVSANNPDDVARVQEFLDWLFAADRYGNADAVLRRAGLVSVIWNRRSWSTTYKQWRDYTGPSPHTDHVHFGFAWPGALGETSFFGWLGTAPSQVEPLPPPAIGSKVLLNVVGVAAAAGGVYWLYRRLVQNEGRRFSRS